MKVDIDIELLTYSADHMGNNWLLSVYMNTSVIEKEIRAEESMRVAPG